ncbi:MAG: hypothetical protein M5U09_20385 [Gammaproteobacteria bacterium]|nr:hypothetical protein [Gammaproteobacteria bacterium]
MSNSVTRGRPVVPPLVRILMGRSARSSEVTGWWLPKGGDSGDGVLEVFARERRDGRDVVEVANVARLESRRGPAPAVEGTCHASVTRARNRSFCRARISSADMRAVDCSNSGAAE